MTSMMGRVIDDRTETSGGETALITGCSTGIGRETVRAFLAADWTVYATARDRHDLGGLADRGAKTAALDVTNEANVTAVVDGVLTAEGRIDCLVNNAGYGQLGAVEDVPTADVVRQFDVNVFGPHRLVRAVLPHMRSRDAGRIVNVSSAVDRFVLPGTGVYCGSKFALRAMSDALRQELYGTGVDVVVIEPWLTATDFFERAVDETRRLKRSQHHTGLYDLLGRLEAVDADVPGVADSSVVAKTILRAATEENPDAYYLTSLLARCWIAAGSLLSDRRRDAVTNLAISLLAGDGESRRPR